MIRTACVREGNVLLTLSADGDGFYTAVVQRKGKYITDYIVCTAYNIEDGTWGNGTYFTTFEGAMVYFCQKIVSRYDMEVVKNGNAEEIQ